MAFWNSSEILDINEGSQPNDGTGDNIRAAFLKVDGNFSNVSSFLSQPSLDFLNANVQQNLSVGTATFSNIFVANATGTLASFTSNVTGSRLIANLGIYSLGTTILTGNATVGNLDVNGTLSINSDARVSAAMIPTANVTYDLGSPTYFFRNIYAQGVVEVNTVSIESDASILQLHSNLTPGDTKDVGVLGKFYKNSSNSYAYFGYQYATDNFIYKITDTDVTLGNSVVYDGVYGNVQFGSQLLSNTTVSTSKTTGALIVAGGVGVGGNVYATAFNGNLSGTVANVARMSVSGTVSGNLIVDGEIHSGGFQVLTTSNIGAGTPYTGGIVTGNTVFASATRSTTTTTGAVVVPNGGMGVGGNITVGGNLVAVGVVGPYYGAIQTAAQPNITSLGTLSSLNVGSVSATSIGATDISVSNSISMSGATITNLLSLTVVGNVSVGNVSAAKGTFTSVEGTLLTAGQTNITTVGTLNGLTVNSTGLRVNGTIIAATINAGTIGNASANIVGTIGTAAQTNITSVGTLSSLIVNSGGLRVNGTIIATTLNAATIGNTSANIVGTIGTAAQTNITSVGTLTGLTVGASGLRVNGTITATTLNAGTIGNTSASIVGTISTAVQTNITQVGTLNGLTINSSGLIVNGTIQAPTIGNSGAVLTGTLSTAAQTNITSVGTLSSLTVSGNASTGNVSGTKGTFTSVSGTLLTAAQSGITSVGTLTGLTVSGAIVPSSNVTVNIGSTGAWFNNIYGVAIQAQYADLAEHYEADSAYAPGTVVVFGGTAEITTTNEMGDERVAGAISTDPAYLMNAANPGVPVALRGRVPVKVMGPVNKGDSLVTSSTPGYAVSVGRDRAYGQAVFAKSLETNTDVGAKIITAVIL